MKMPAANGRKTTLVKVTKNSYGMIILDGTVDGKRHRLSTGKKADKRQQKWYERHADDEFFKLHEQKFGAAKYESPTFEEYGSMILKITSHNRNQLSQEDEQGRFKNLCKFFGKMRLSEIKASHVMTWQHECGLAAKTIRNHRSIFNMILEMALHDDLITKNPLRFVKTPRIEYKEVQVFSEEEIKLLIQNSSGQFKNILMFNFFAGLRASELIALRWSKINFEENKIRIDRRRRKGVEDVPKGKRIRVIDMLPQAKEALKNQWQLTGIKNEYVFLAQRGKPYNRADAINKKLKKLCSECDIKPGTTHIIRKSCNTLLKQYGLPLDWILDQLGHIEDSVNREHYTGKIKPDLSKIGRVLAESKNDKPEST